VKKDTAAVTERQAAAHLTGLQTFRLAGNRRLTARRSRSEP
jgi:hypothetical protein